jgi:dihydrofolate reductase
MNKVFFSVGISTDGFIAGDHGGPENPLGDRGTEIHKWMFIQKNFREQLALGQGGETGRDNDMLTEIITRTGASILGKRMFEEGEANWPENAPFHTPVFVLSKHKRDPWKRPGGTTFYFVNNGIESALALAREAAGNKDVRISGGADVIRQFLNAGLIDEFTLHLSPIILGNGVRLFENIEKEKFSLEIIEAIYSTLVTHLKYKVIK